MPIEPDKTKENMLDDAHFKTLSNGGDNLELPTYLVLYGHLIWYLHLFVFLGFNQHLALQTPNCPEYINP
jgi:hypothetical protein